MKKNTQQSSVWSLGKGAQTGLPLPCARTGVRSRKITLRLTMVATSIFVLLFSSLPVNIASASDPGTGDWPMWGGSPDRNMVSNMKGLPTNWDVTKKTNVKLLLERGADPDVRDTFYNATPMSWAAPKGFVEIVKLLIEKGAKDKGAALNVGVDKGSVPLVKVVLEKGGVAPETLTKALGKAETAKHSEIVDLLQKAGAKPFQKLSEEQLKSYEGFYKSEQRGDFNFMVKEGKLSGKFNTQNWFTLGAINQNTFTALEFDGVTIIFNLEGDKVTSCTLKQGGGTVTFKKAEQK